MFVDNPEDPFVLLRLPMTKAAVRAMVKPKLFISRMKQNS